MIDSGCFGHVCPPWFAPQFPMMSSTNVEAVAANNLAPQHYGHVTTNSGRRIFIQVTFDVMSVRKPFLSTSALKRRGVTIIFNHDYDRIIFRNETVNLISHDCHSYLRITLANGIPPRKAMVMAWRLREMTWTRKSTATMEPRDVRLKKLQLVIDEQSPMRIKRDSLTFLVKRKLQEHHALLNHPQTLRGWHTATHVFIQRFLPILCCESRTKFSAQASCGEQDGGYSAEIPDGLRVRSTSGREQNSAMHYICGNAQWSDDQLHVRPEWWL